jgi:hypothetical protein
VDPGRLNIFNVADALTARGWSLSICQNPGSLSPPAFLPPSLSLTHSLSVSISVCLSVCLLLSLSLSFSLSFSLSISLYLSLSLSICLYLSPSLFLSLSLPLFLYLSLSQSVRTPDHSNLSFQSDRSSMTICEVSPNNYSMNI